MYLQDISVFTHNCLEMERLKPQKTVRNLEEESIVRFQPFNEHVLMSNSDDLGFAKASQLFTGTKHISQNWELHGTPYLSLMH